MILPPDQYLWDGLKPHQTTPEFLFSPVMKVQLAVVLTRKMPPRNGEMNIPIVVCSSASELILQDFFGVKIRIIMILNGWLATRNYKNVTKSVQWEPKCSDQSAPTGVSRRRLETAFRHGRGEWSARSSNWYIEICCSGYYIIYRGFQKTIVFPKKTLSTQRFPKIWPKKTIKNHWFPHW